MTRGFGAELRRVLAASTKNRILAFLSGIGVTAFLQSSTATVLIVAAFAGQGMVSASSGLAIVLGADVGTTLVAQFLSVDMRFLPPLFMVCGYILFSIEHSGRIKNVGRIFVGLALMMLALAWIRETAEPLKTSETLPLILAPLEKDAFFAMLVLALLTWMTHSSLAVVLLLMSLVSTGVLPLMLGLFMVLGVNVGGTVAPLLSTLRDNPDAMRIPLGNMLVRIVGMLAVMPFIPVMAPYLAKIDPDPGRQIINFHMVYNIFLALVFLPFTGVISSVLIRALPHRPQADDPQKPKYLNDKDLDTPSVALAEATRETLRLADMLQRMLEDTMKVFKNNDERLVDNIREQDDTIDRLYAAIKTYMARLTQEFMDPKEAQRYLQILMFSTNLEHAGDVIDKNLMPLAQKKIRNQYSFSPEGLKEIEHIHALVLESVQLSQSVFVSGDSLTAKRLVDGKDLIRRAEAHAMTAHFERLRALVPDTIATSSLHLDIIRDYRRINAHVCAAALALLEEGGKP